MPQRRETISVKDISENVKTTSEIGNTKVDRPQFIDIKLVDLSKAKDSILKKRNDNRQVSLKVSSSSSSCSN